MPLAIGARLGPYEILSALGAGGMGEVYKARDTRLDRVVAIKVLSSALGDESARRRFEREARAASSLNHPHIVAVYDVGEFEGRQYLVTEFVDAGTLKQWAAQAGKRTWREIVELVAGVADGLAAAHEAGILHRDIKPDNILIPRSGYAKLADFGLAKLAEAGDLTRTLTQGQTRPGAIVGTIAYMSPEQADGRSVDARSDIFSLGVVLYELLSGRRPFGGTTDLEVLQTVISGEPQPLGEDVPQPLRTIVEKALEKDPAERYQSARELTVDLRRFARQPASSATGRPAVRSRARFWLVAATALIVLAAAGGVAVWRGRSTETTAAPAAAGIRSIAVLMFQNLSGDPNQEYFSDGMTEELIAHVAQIHALRVISRTSVMGYRGTTKTVPEIGRELGVDAIIEGSVRRSGDRVRVTAQLIRVTNDTHLWAKDYDQDVSDVLKLQADVARAIAQEIQVQLTPEETTRLASARRVNPAALDETLLGHYYRWKLSQENQKQAIEHYRRALQLEPDYAPAYAGLAFAWQNLTGPEAVTSSRAAAIKALDADPDLAEAHAAMAAVYSREWDWTASDRESRRALELNPNSLDSCGCYALFLATVGRYPEAFALSDRMLATDPLASTSHQIYGIVLYLARRFEDAVPRFRRAIEIDPDNVSAYRVLAQVYQATGKAEDAVTLLNRPAFKDSGPLGVAYASAGHRAEAARIVQALVKAANPDRRRIALIYFALGDKDRGLEWLAKSLDAHEPQAPVLVDPSYDSVRSDPRFQALLARLKFPPTS